MLVTSALHMQDLCTDLHKSLRLWIFAEGEKQALYFFFITILKDMPTETVSRFL